jgi:hypothetical protein
VCEILACKQSDSRAKELLDVLWELHLWPGGSEIDDKIIEGLHHLAIQSGIESPRLAGFVAEKLWEMCFHLVGPHEVAMDRRDLGQVLKCLAALETVAEFNSMFGHGRRAADQIAKQAENFFELSLWYSQRRIANGVIRIYQKSLSECYHKKKLEFAYGSKRYRQSIKRVRRMLISRKPGWDYQKRRLAQLLSI